VDQPFVGLGQGSVAELVKRLRDPLVAFGLGRGEPLEGAAAMQEIGDLLQGLKVFDIHDDFHPAIMNDFWRSVQTHFMLETRPPLQTHLILEEASA
jgi:hypothetical protein